MMKNIFFRSFRSLFNWSPHFFTSFSKPAGILIFLSEIYESSEKWKPKSVFLSFQSPKGLNTLCTGGNMWHGMQLAWIALQVLQRSGMSICGLGGNQELASLRWRADMYILSSARKMSSWGEGEKALSWNLGDELACSNSRVLHRYRPQSQLSQSAARVIQTEPH